MSHLLIIHKVEERRCTRRRVPSSFSRNEETRPLYDVKSGPAKSGLYASVRERTDARLGHGVVAIHSGSYWIINTLDLGNQF
ncbi:hypothetical protein [Aneurinibacillus migulanus]|uniref:hypothetical protein n=1 Tax=Aneurinibacillus migulanus TaxID=47500 RepID=UPI001F1B4BDC|nr:hypothetical protein [Aneurinibacillus migulanus]